MTRFRSLQSESDAISGYYTITQGDDAQRRRLHERLYGLDRLPRAVAERVVTAWATTWLSSEHDLDDLPYHKAAPDYRLMDHVNDVTKMGLAFAEAAGRDWSIRVDEEIFLAILILHDVDKPLLYQRRQGQVVLTPAAAEVPHGVLGGFLLKELGFAPAVYSTVATHASKSPFHGATPEAYILHYADYFSSDKAFIEAGAKPLYQP